MDIHVRRLGTFNILFGAVSLLFSSLLFLVYGGPLGLYQSTEDNIVGLLMSTSAIAHLLIAVPCIVGGVYIRQYAEWSRGLLIVTSALNILNVPLGCVLGGYGLWVLLTPETEPLFDLQNNGRVSRKPVGLTGSVEKQATRSESRIVPSPRS